MAFLVSQRRRRGGALVEAAFVLPLLALLTFGLIEYGWLFMKANQVTYAARQGARTASLPNATNATVLQSVASQMTQAGLGASGYTVTLTPLNVSTVSAGETVRVEISLPYSAVALTGGSLVPVPPTLSGSVAMSKEGS
jgi:Flp pilus assembly protein TadG